MAVPRFLHFQPSYAPPFCSNPDLYAEKVRSEDSSYCQFQRTQRINELENWLKINTLALSATRQRPWNLLEDLENTTTRAAPATQRRRQQSQLDVHYTPRQSVVTTRESRPRPRSSVSATVTSLHLRTPSRTPLIRYDDQDEDYSDDELSTTSRQEENLLTEKPTRRQTTKRYVSAQPKPRSRVRPRPSVSTTVTDPQVAAALQREYKTHTPTTSPPTNVGGCDDHPSLHDEEIATTTLCDDISYTTASPEENITQQEKANHKPSTKSKVPFQRRPKQGKWVKLGQSLFKTPHSPAKKSRKGTGTFFYSSSGEK